MALRQYQGGSRRSLEAAVDPTQRQLLQQGPQSLHAATFYTYVQYPLRLGRLAVRVRSEGRSSQS